MANSIDAVKQLQKEIDVFKGQLTEINGQILEISKNTRGVTDGFSKIKTPKGVNSALKETSKNINEIDKLVEKRRLSEIKLDKAREKSFDSYTALLKKESKQRESQVNKESALIERLKKQRESESKQREAQVNKESALSERLEKQRESEIKQRESQVNKESALRQRLLAQRKKEETEREKSIALSAKEAEQIKKAAAVSKEYSRILNVTIRKRNVLAKTIQDLNVKRELGNKLSDKEQAELKQSTAQFEKYDKAIKKAKTSVGRFQENVGNYPKGLKAAASAARGLASAMGLVGGAFLIVGAVKDAFNRIREFDKSMQNLSGILRVSRKDVKDLESEIISVAKASVRTSTEVATLAESLLTLGKSKEEVKALLAPVTDLSLGLNVAADEAGEFLVQMLNTFGGSIDEADKYADTIATIRTSTSLDFQKMRDSFQYLAPISKVLNKDLAYTGALIGILADNGIKAERAGRLLGTAQQKLAAEGKSLTDALDEINTASQNNVSELDLLALSSKLFGKQAASLGVVLANNTDAIDTNAQAIRDNGGALDDLVKEQMESLDSKIKLLDSAWEGLITTVDNGKGTLSSFFKGAVKGATDFLNTLTDINKVSEIIGEKDEGFFNGWLLESIGGFFRLRDATVEYQAILKEFDTIDLTNINEVQSGIDIWEEMKKEMKGNEDAIKALDFFINKLKESEKGYYKNKDEQKKKQQAERKLLEEKATALKYAGQAYDDHGKVVKNVYNNVGEASEDDLKKFIANNEKKVKAAGDGDDAINDSRKRSKAVYIELSNVEKEVNKELLESWNTLKDAYSEDSSFSLPEIDQEALSLFAQEINDKVSEDLKLQFAKDEITEGLNDLAGTIEEFTGVSGDKFLDFFDKISEGGEKSFTDLAEIASSSFSLAGDVSNAFFQGKIDSYQEDIDANNEYYANLLDNENLSNEERDRLEADRRRKEAQLKKKQAKEKEKQFQVNKLFRIGEIIADTALSIAKTGATLGYPLAVPFQIQAAVIGAAQLAIVAAQPTPKFAEGGVMDHDGKMMINDHSSGRLELVERDGKLLMTDKKNAIVDGQKGDIIHKDAKAYFDNQTDDDLIKNLENHSILASMQQNNFLANRLENKKAADNNSYNTDRIVKAIKSQKTKFNVNQNISLADDLSFLGRINDTL